jgi:tetratricopeptide (TPR) repeat protein
MSNTAPLSLHNLLPSAIYLIERAGLRTKHIKSSTKRFSLGIRRFAELVDMFHNRKATVPHDRVYALLGMSSDDPGLAFNYDTPWEDLFEKLVKHVLSNKLSVDIFIIPKADIPKAHIQRAEIRSKGCVLGRVSLVEIEGDWSDMQTLGITSRNAPMYMGCTGEWEARWTLQASAIPVKNGDIICLLAEAQHPSIIRLDNDHFKVIMASITAKDVQLETESIKFEEVLRSIRNFPHDFLLVWDWDWEMPSERSDDESQKQNLSFARPLKHGELDTTTKLFNAALILKDVKEYEEAKNRFQEAGKNSEQDFGLDHSKTLKYLEYLVLFHREREEWNELEELLKETISKRRRLLGLEHQDTVTSMRELALCYRGQGHIEKAKHLGMIVEIFKQKQYWNDGLRNHIIGISRSFGGEEITLFFDVLEPSSRDFRFDYQGCTNQQSKARKSVIHEGLAKQCLDILSAHLKEDICNVQGSGMAVSNVEVSTVQKAIPPEVEYACTYWIQHILNSEVELGENYQIYQFLKYHILHWFEALSWIGRLSDGIHALSALKLRISVGLTFFR